MSKKQKHVHKYKRYTYKKSGHIVYRCMLPLCIHFINDFLLPGRACICWRCGNEFIVKNTLLAKPHCFNCNETKDHLETHVKSNEVAKNINVDKLSEMLG